jgi:hypothetical protein
VREATELGGFSLAVTPETLLVGGFALPAEQPVADAARMLHDRDVLQLSFGANTPLSALQALLKLLSTDSTELRNAGGPAILWASQGQPTIVIDQIDYEKLLQDRAVERPPDRRDDLWRSLVTSIVQGQKELDEAQQGRLLEISRSATAIGDLAADAIEPMRNLDGSPLVTTQAATVLAVFRHLAGIVTVMEPERLSDTMRNLASAAAGLDPHVVMQMMQMDDAAQDSEVLARIAASFDDGKVAQLLATALSRDGKATARLAQVFDTIAPDPERKRRVLTMTQSMLAEEDFGRSGQFQAVWSTMETLLLNYNETPYVSGSYQAALDGAGSRGEMLAAREVPPEFADWVDSLGEENVRALSVVLITDLLRIEENAERAAEIVRDMIPLVDDLLLAGDFANAILVLEELKKAAGGTLVPAAARSALTTAGESPALREAASLLGELDANVWSRFADCCDLIGPTATRALLPLLEEERETMAFHRARRIIEKFGAPAIPLVALLVDDERWFVHCRAAELLGHTHSAAAVPPLQALLRKPDPRVLYAAVSALAGIADPAAARALQTVLRTATGEARIAVVEALVAERDLRVVPMLGRILEESDPFTVDHQVVLDTLDAIAQLGDERAVPAVTATMRRTRLFRRRKALAFKGASIRALMAIGTPRAKTAIDDAVRDGDRLLRKVIREMSK